MRRDYIGTDHPNTGLAVRDTDGSHTVTLKPGSNVTANRTVTIVTGDADRTLDLTGSSSGISAQHTLALRTFWG